MAHFRHQRLAKILLASLGVLLLVLITNSAIRLRSQRATFERCRHLHSEVVEKLEGLKKLSLFSTPSGYDDAWNNACETIRITFGTSWGHFPSRTPESAYQSLSADLDTILQSESAQSVMLEQMWVRIGNSGPHLYQHLQEKEHVFRESLARLKQIEGAS